MAKFKVLSMTVVDQTPEIINTEVKYTFDDARTLTLFVSHFRPADEFEMRANIITRGKSEWNRLLAVDKATLALADLNQYLNVSVNFSQS